MPFERRALIAICLVFMVLYVWQAFFVKPVPKTAGAGAVAEAGAAGAKAGTVGAAADLGGVATASGGGASPAAPVISPGASAVVSDANERDVRIETSTV